MGAGSRFTLWLPMGAEKPALSPPPQAQVAAV